VVLPRAGLSTLSADYARAQALVTPRFSSIPSFVVMFVTPLDTVLKVLVIAALFAAAFGVARLSALIARKLLAWHDRLHRDAALDVAGRLAEIKRRETTVAMIRAGIALGAFLVAALLAVAQFAGGVDRLATLAGASFAVLVAGFAAQRLLADVIAGLSMFTERWYSVGDTIVVAGGGLDVQGVVEDMTLRRTKLRSLNGEVVHVHNSQIPAVRVLPSGVKELAIEFFAKDKSETEALVHAVASMLPQGPTTFVRRPWIEDLDDVSESLVRVRLRVTVAPGSEWLAENFLLDLLKERAGHLIVHGPVALAVDEGAARSFARAAGAARTAA
jgi:moderate conductance mechanosensitive channel